MSVNKLAGVLYLTFVLLPVVAMMSAAGWVGQLVRILKGGR